MKNGVLERKRKHNYHPDGITSHFTLHILLSPSGEQEGAFISSDAHRRLVEEEALHQVQGEPFAVACVFHVNQ